MERESVEGPAGEIVVGQGFRCVNRLLSGIKARLNLVGDNARRQGVTGLHLGLDCSLAARLAA
jgi:hypothetical protein